MKRKVSSIFFALLFPASCCLFPLTGQVPLPHYDGFDYTPEHSLHDQPGWSLAYTGTEPVIKSGSLTMPGLPSSTGNKITFDGGGADPYMLFTPQNIPGTSVFYSFIFQVTNVAGLNATGSHFAGIQSGTTGAAMVWIKSDGAGGFLIGHSARSATGVSWSPSSYSVHTPVFIVGCYNIEGEYNAVMIPGDDKTYLWIDPESTEFGLPDFPAPELSCNLTTGTASRDLADIKSFYIRQDGPNTTPFIEMDELRIGTSWKDVTAEITPPSWTDGYPKVDNVTSAGFTMKASMNETGTFYYTVLASGTAPPSSIQAKEGTGSVISGSFVGSGAGTEFTKTEGFLIANTTYDIYFVAEDNILNLQAEPATVSITTLKLNPPELLPAFIGQDVEHNFAISFIEDTDWRSSIIDVKVDGTSLNAADWDKTTEGSFIIKPLAGNALLTVPGSKLITICAPRYNDAEVIQNICHGALNINKSEIVILPFLAPGITSTVTINAKDQFENPIPDYVFKLDADISDNSGITDEIYKINSTDYNMDATNVILPKTDALGITSFAITLNPVIDQHDGITIRILLFDGITFFGSSFPYLAPGIPVLLLSGNPDETNLAFDVITLSLHETSFKDTILDPAHFILNDAPAGLTVRDVRYETGTGAVLSFNYDGTDFDSDKEFSVTVDASELASVNDLSGNSITIAANIETVPFVVTSSEISSVGSSVAIWGGNVAGDGGEVVIEKGMCWSLSPFPDTNDPRTIESVGIGLITGSISGLNPNTLYYIKAYATNSVGTAYGEEKSFATLNAEPENQITGLFPDGYKEYKITIYPNPVIDQITIEMLGTEFGFLEIISFSGAKVIEYKILEPIINLDVSCLDKGFYIIYLRSKRNFYAARFLKI